MSYIFEYGYEMQKDSKARMYNENWYINNFKKIKIINFIKI
jgi:hypothetical protein